MKFEHKRISWIALVVFTGLCGIYLINLQVLAEDFFELEKQLASPGIIEGNTFIANVAPPVPEVARTIKVFVTAYSSTVAQTDDTPFITASGELVRDGIVANNLLSFGTGIRLPELFGEEVFIVKDRMHRRKGDYHVDIWFPTTEEAIQFGAKTTIMEILAN